MINALYINDNNLVVHIEAEAADSRRYSSLKGYAWLRGDKVVFDSDADDSPVRNCRIAPQEINTRYWQHCDQNTIAANGAGMRNAADLIWRHLNELKHQHQLQDLVLVVPSHYREANLQLLLGVAKSSGLEISGLVNKAILALSSHAATESDYLHVDVQLHQTVVSAVKVEGGLIKLGSVDVLQDVGIHTMQEALLKGLQQNFIRNDRFDPLHDAATEQQLFDQLSDIALQINESGKANIGLQHQGRIHSSSIDAKEWDALLTPFVDRILEVSKQRDPSTVLVDLNAAFESTVPAILEAARVTVLQGVPVLTPDVKRSTDDGSLVYLTELPAATITQAATKKSRPDVPAAKSSTPTNQATHLLFAGRAVPIDSAEVVSAANTLRVKPGSPNVMPLLANGKLFIMNDESRKELRVNDRIGSQLADGVITVIQVLQ